MEKSKRARRRKPLFENLVGLLGRQRPAGRIKSESALRCSRLCRTYGKDRYLPRSTFRTNSSIQGSASFQ
jgi:hypothetical protein